MTMENIELFDQYISGSLSPEQQKEFDARLKSDKRFASDFKIYLFTVKGIIQEADQDNTDFGNAMKHLSKDKLLEIIGRRKKPGIFRFGYVRERLAWASGIAALFIVFFVSIYFTWKVGNDNVDDMLVNYYYLAESKNGVEYKDVSHMSKEEVKDLLPKLITAYENAPEDDLQAQEDAGMRVALAYLKLHDRKMARQWLNTLIEKYWDDQLFLAQCQNILEEID